jgi:RimJ/RimL family protein N-acetyltransferase
MEWINDINSADKMLDIMNNNGRNIVFGIYKNESYIGEFIVSPNYNTCICILGFWIDKDFARKGIISASLRVLEKELKLDGFNSAQLEIKTENKSSIECAKRNGYELVSTERYETGESIQLYDIFVKKF